MKIRFVALLLLAGCVALPTKTPFVQTLVYNCEDGQALTAREDGASLWLYLPTGTRQLTNTYSEQGRLYTAAGLEFLKKGDEAWMKIDGQWLRLCRRDSAAALWEDARFRDIVFRAAGNEPGWFVEVDREKIVYAGHYGQQLLTFPAVPAQRDDRLAETRYVSATTEHKLNLLLQIGDCRDPMSGKMFDTRVTLNLDDQILYGCGRSLN